MNNIEIAGILSDAMINEIKNKKLIEEIAKLEHVEELINTIKTMFVMKLMPMVIEYAENDEEIKKEIDEEDAKTISIFKTLFNIKENK